MGITFAVDDVTPALERLAEHAFPLVSLSARETLGSSHAEIALVDKGMPEVRRFGGPPEDRIHALAQAVDLAFNEHRPLRLTPDAIWITLSQGFSIHVRENAEALRARFVRHEGKKTLSVVVLKEPRGDEWRDVIADFGAMMADDLGPGVVAMLTRPFSTTGPDERTVFRIALMETFQEYFEYEMVCICGIPEVTLEGTVDDWRDIKRRVEVMAEYDLRWWADALLPVCDQWIATAEGKPDREFWRAIHRPEEVYGGHLITGWLTRLFPYVEGGNGWMRNDLRPARKIPEDAEKPPNYREAMQRMLLRGRAADEESGAIVPWAHPGVSPRSLPASWSRAEVVGGELCAGRAFIVSGGLLGVKQAPGAKTLEPAVVWHVEGAPDFGLWPRLETAHGLSPRGARPDGGSRFGTALRGGLSAFYARYEGARLFEGAIEMLAPGVITGSLPRGPLGLVIFGRVGANGALAWMQRTPPDGRAEAASVPAGEVTGRISVDDLRGAVLRRRTVAGLAVSERLPARLDWVLYIPEGRGEAIDEYVVIALDTWGFFQQLAAHPTPYFLREDVPLPGRLIDVLRDPPIASMTS